MLYRAPGGLPPPRPPAFTWGAAAPRPKSETETLKSGPQILGTYSALLHKSCDIFMNLAVAVLGSMLGPYLKGFALRSALKPGAPKARPV